MPVRHIIPIYFAWPDELIDKFSRAAYIAFRVYVLWDQSRRMKAVICVALAVTYIPAAVLMGFSNASFFSMWIHSWFTFVHKRLTSSRIGTTIFSPIVNSCVITTGTVPFKLFFACVVSVPSRADVFYTSYSRPQLDSDSIRLKIAHLWRTGGHSHGLQRPRSSSSPPTQIGNRPPPRWSHMVLCACFTCLFSSFC